MGDNQLQQQPLEKHYCNVTFLSVGDTGPDGLPIERLLRCTRCQETYYCGKVQQKSHWKIHKKVCKPASEDSVEERFQSLTLGEVAVTLYQEYFHPTAQLLDNYSSIREHNLGRSFRFLLERLQTLCSNGSNAVTPTSEEYALFQQLVKYLPYFSMVDNPTIDFFWAIPGMTTFMFNLELLSDAMRQRKLVGAAPTADELEFQGCDPSFQNTCPYFAITICYFLMASIFRADRKKASVRTFRGGPIASFAARKMMLWYADPYTRASFPSLPETSIRAAAARNLGISPRDVVFPMVFKELLESLPADPLTNMAFLPGLTAQDTVQILISEPT